MITMTSADAARTAGANDDDLNTAQLIRDEMGEQRWSDTFEYADLDYSQGRDVDTVEAVFSTIHDSSHYHILHYIDYASTGVGEFDFFSAVSSSLMVHVEQSKVSKALHALKALEGEELALALMAVVICFQRELKEEHRMLF